MLVFQKNTQVSEKTGTPKTRARFTFLLLIFKLGAKPVDTKRKIVLHFTSASKNNKTISKRTVNSLGEADVVAVCPSFL